MIAIFNNEQSANVFSNKIHVFMILFLFSFALSAQENWEFRADNRLHFGAGVVIAVISLPLMYEYTDDLEGSANGAFWVAAASGGAKEILDLLKYLITRKGVGASYTDFTYTFIGAVTGALLTKFIIVLIQKHKQKKWDEKFNIEF